MKKFDKKDEIKEEDLVDLNVNIEKLPYDEKNPALK